MPKRKALWVDRQKTREWAKYHLFGALYGAAGTENLDPLIEELMEAAGITALPPEPPTYTFPDVSNI
jgi:hypothetical protein